MEWVKYVEQLNQSVFCTCPVGLSYPVPTLRLLTKLFKFWVDVHVILTVHGLECRTAHWHDIDRSNLSQKPINFNSSSNNWTQQLIVNYQVFSHICVRLRELMVFFVSYHFSLMTINFSIQISTSTNYYKNVHKTNHSASLRHRTFVWHSISVAFGGGCPLIGDSNAKATDIPTSTININRRVVIDPVILRTASEPILVNVRWYSIKW